MDNTLERAELVFSRLTKNARKIIVAAYEVARIDANNLTQEIKPKHIFVAVLQNRSTLAARLLEKLNIDLVRTSEAVLGNILTEAVNGSFVPNADFRKLIGEAFLESAALGHVYVGSEHLLLAILHYENLQFVEDLADSGLSYDVIKQELLNFGSYQAGVFAQPGAPGSNVPNNNMNDSAGDSPFGGAGLNGLGGLGGMPGANGFGGPANGGNALEFFGRNMNEAAKAGEYLPLLGREEEVNRMINILSRRTKNNPILVGEAGVGKTAIVEGFVQKIVKGDVPNSFKDAEVFQVDVAAIIAGAKIRGDVEERIIAIMEELEKSPNRIVFFDEIHMIVGSGSGGGNDIANVLKPYLTRSDFRIIGATTPDEYRKYFEEDSALARRFQPVTVEELDQPNTIEVLKFLRPKFEDFHRVQITDEVVAAAVKLSARYVADRHLPDKAIDLIDEAAAKRKILRSRQDPGTGHLESSLTEVGKKKDSALDSGDLDMAGKLRLQEVEIGNEIANTNAKNNRISVRYKVQVEDLKQIISNWTKIPVSSLSDFDLKNIVAIDKVIGSKIIGQKDAVQRVSSTLKRVKLGLSSGVRPMASFLFLGPTGIGKTETAKIIAKELFGTEDALIQLNMSEYMEAHSVAKIIGSPPGYVGYQDGKNVAEIVRKRPYSLILFDEIEKAHPDTLNILLQILEEGYLMDSHSRKVPFTNTIVVMTSNIGASQIADDKTLGFDVSFPAEPNQKIEEAFSAMQLRILAELKNHLRPELINRIDEVVVFRGLNKEDMADIVKLQLDYLNQKLLERKLSLSYNAKVVNYLAEEGFSKEFGARNVRRKIQEAVENKLAEFILDSNLAADLHKREKKDLPVLAVAADLDSGKVRFSATK